MLGSLGTWRGQASASNTGTNDCASIAAAHDANPQASLKDHLMGRVDGLMAYLNLGPAGRLVRGPELLAGRKIVALEESLYGPLAESTSAPATLIETLSLRGHPRTKEFVAGRRSTLLPHLNYWWPLILGPTVREVLKKHGMNCQQTLSDGSC